VSLNFTVVKPFPRSVSKRIRQSGDNTITVNRQGALRTGRQIRCIYKYKVVNIDIKTSDIRQTKNKQYDIYVFVDCSANIYIQLAITVSGWH
jgi:uncharacterized protein YlaI